MSIKPVPVSPTVADYADRNLWHVAEERLNDLTKDDLKTLRKLVVGKLPEALRPAWPPDAATHTELVADLVVIKKRLPKRGESLAAVPTTEKPDISQLALRDLNIEECASPPRPETPSPTPSMPPSTTTGEPTSIDSSDAPDVLLDVHSLNICSWNSLGLRLGDVKSKDDDSSSEAYAKRAMWFSFAQRVSFYDVIVMQEVPASEYEKEVRTRQFLGLLNSFSDGDAQYGLYFSQPSGKDDVSTGGNADVHALFVRRPIVVRKLETLHRICAVAMDYAPLVVELYDPRFANAADRTVVLTSVHFAPEKRKDARDAQLKLFLKSYAATDTSQYRLQASFGPLGTKQGTDASPIHVVCGDFNVYPGHEQYSLGARGFGSMLPEEAATSKGFKHYDNFLVDTTSLRRMLIGVSILPLARIEGKTQLSEHDPIVLTIEEARSVRKKEHKKKPVRVEATETSAAPVEPTQELPDVD